MMATEPGPGWGPGAPIRVAVLVRKFPKLSETFILNQITGLIDAGHEVDIFAWTAEDDGAVHGDVQAYDLMGRTHYLQVPRSRLRRIAGTLRRMGGSRGAWRRPSLVLRSLDARRYGRAAASLELLYAGASLARNGPYDIVHCQFGQLGPAALTFRETGALSGRLVVSFRGWDVTGHRGRDRYGALFRTADLFLPVCDVFRDRLIEMGCDPARIRVHRSGLDPERFRFFERRRAPDAPTRLVSVARLVEKKGVEYGIRAVARLMESGRPVVYTIVGDGPLRPELEALADGLGVRGAVRFDGELDHDGVMAALADAHLLVAPSVTARDGDQEGIPNSLKEAMATGMPVVTTLHSGIPELVEDGVSGFLVPERDVDALAGRLIFLADHPERWPPLGRAGRERIEADYDARTLNRRLAELYGELLSGSEAVLANHA